MVLENIYNYIKTLPSYCEVGLEVLGIEDDAISIRSRGGVITHQYWDGTRVGNFSFDIMAKSKNKQLAINQLELYKKEFTRDVELVLTGDYKISTANLNNDYAISLLTDQKGTVYKIGITIEYEEKEN